MSDQPQSEQPVSKDDSAASPVQVNQPNQAEQPSDQDVAPPGDIPVSERPEYQHLQNSEEVSRQAEPTVPSYEAEGVPQVDDAESSDAETLHQATPEQVDRA